MPTTTYTPIASQTLSSTTSSITFSSIPSTYRDLILIISAAASVNTGIRARFNGDTNTNYTSVYLQGNGSSAFSATRSFGFLDLSNFGPRTTFEFSNIINLMDYSVTDKHKSILQRPNTPSASVEAYASRWASTSAISSIEIYVTSGTFSIGSVFSLFGVIA